MAAPYYLVVRYDVTAELMTPLRTGGADGDTETVLRKANGQPFIQGTSLAGALRDCVHTSAMAKFEERLFGSQGLEGSLIVSEGLFEDEAEQFTRPRIKIDQKTGTAENQMKFDVAHIGAGAKFKFTLTWLGTEEKTDELSAVSTLLGALNKGSIRLGAQKSSGFGRVEIKVRQQAFDLRKEKDREAWLLDEEGGEEFLPKKIRDSRFVNFQVTGRLDDLLVKASAAEHSETGSYTPNMKEGRTAVIPGTSIKGAVRARVEAAAAAMGIPSEVTDELFGREAGEADNGIPGKVIFEDIRMERAAKRKITRICIDRFSGAVVDGALFREEPVCSDVTLKIMVPARNNVGCGLILFALRDLALGLYGFGSGRASGRGIMDVKTITADLGKDRAVINFDSEKKMSTEDPAGLVSQWMSALKNGGKA